MDGVITALVAGLTPGVLFGVIADLVPWLIVIVPVALGIYFLRRGVKGAGRGKVSL